MPSKTGSLTTTVKSHTSITYSTDLLGEINCSITIAFLYVRTLIAIKTEEVF